MTPETFTFTNASGSTLSVTFDESNAVEDENGVGIRIPATICNEAQGEHRFTIVVSAYKQTYPTLSIFCAKFEGPGKRQIVEWLRASSDQLIMPHPDMENAWTTDIERRPANTSSEV
jgi:hypothetical protein